ncbi:UNVERIFIED_CONTAM: class I heat shock protein [Sesamum calycinum]|uniref:Class I heat shock protein n=1 Tax=Sesamum calycinum TaxID=2727403 RepID=A0AAW2IW91_9LAMI
MAMRPRGGGAAAPRRAARPGAVRPVYEDFKPMSEWQQDDESHILNIYLPGFMKEQIRVSTEGRNTIRVQGERLVAGNKWSRFREDFQVPENSEMNSVRAKYQGGVLNITIPKKEVDKAQETFPPKPNSSDTQKQPTPPEKVLPEVNTSQPTDEKRSEPKKPSDDPRTKQAQNGDEKQTKPQQGQDKAFPAVGTSQPTDDKTSEAQKQSTNHRKDQDHDQNEGRDKRNISPLRITGAVVSQDAVKRESAEPKEQHIASKRPEDVTTRTVDKEERNQRREKNYMELRLPRTFQRTLEPLASLKRRQTTKNYLELSQRRNIRKQ